MSPDVDQSMALFCAIMAAKAHFPRLLFLLMTEVAIRHLRFVLGVSLAILSVGESASAGLLLVLSIQSGFRGRCFPRVRLHDIF